MLSSYLSLAFLGLVIDVTAVPFPSTPVWRRSDNSSVRPYALPGSGQNLSARANAVEYKRQNFLYGPSPAGLIPFFPTGSLGDAIVSADLSLEGPGISATTQAVGSDQASALGAVQQAGGFKSLSDYELLYKDQWKQTAPEGVDAGMLSNYTQDLLFSMERLSVNAFSIRRLHPTEDTLAFNVDDVIVKKLSGETLESLHATGRIFYADHRGQNDLPKTTRYAAACDAYFYIHPRSGDFLPLAIRPNAGSDLIYTPLDQENDWLLAKIMFNVNDFSYGQFYHFAATHEVAELVYEAAIRTLSDNHPILGILNRIVYRAFEIRIILATRLINPGGPIDTLFPITGAGGGKLIDDLYASGAGAIRSKYFYTDLESRGLHGCEFGPKLKHFPFFDDASAIHSNVVEFMEKFISSYYDDDAAIVNDNELQSWMVEAVPAKIIDFPPAPVTNKKTIVELLTHLVYLTTIVHHSLNTNELIESSSTLPFHPFSLYAPIPTSKGDTDVLPFLPPPAPAVGQVGLTSFFSRQRVRGTNQTLVYLFDDEAVFSRMNKETRRAGKDFMHAMKKVSGRIGARKFDGQGLSQGMPFLWRALDPGDIPFWLAI